MRRISVLVVLGMVAAIASGWGFTPAGAVAHPLVSVQPAIASGRLHSCGLLAAGTVVCWGDNSYGELGNASIVESSVPVQVHGVGNVGVLSGVTAITAGNGFSCALLATKTVDCWGYGGDGELGGTGSSLVPVKVHGVGNVGLLTGVRAVTAGNGFASALLAKTVDCWGANTQGELGIHTNKKSATPVAVHGIGNVGVLSGVRAIAAGSADTPCALLVTKTVACWGSNTNGELGNNTNAGQSVPVNVHGVENIGSLGDVTAITGAGSDSSCALIAGGTVDCWGFDGSLGINSAAGNSLTPAQVDGIGGVGVLNGATAIVDRSNVPCALITGGTVDCWGFGGGDQLGDGAEADGNVPGQVDGLNGGILEGATAISAGQLSSCALTTDGSVDCWGTNGNGELGDGNSVIDSAIPVQVHGIANVGFLTL